MSQRCVCSRVWGPISWTRFRQEAEQNRSLPDNQSKRWISPHPFLPQSAATLSHWLCSARLGGAESAVLPVRLGSSPAGNQASFFHEAVSVEERLWISPAASASDTSCCTSGNMTSALPSQLTAPERTTLYLMTRRLQSDLSRGYGPLGCESSVRFLFYFFLMRHH